MSNPVRPEDILPDGVDNTTFNGKIVRKGTVAAFIANADILENPSTTETQKLEAIDTMKELAPGVIASGLHKHVIFKKQAIEKILANAEIA